MIDAEKYEKRTLRFVIYFEAPIKFSYSVQLRDIFIRNSAKKACQSS